MPPHPAHTCTPVAYHHWNTSDAWLAPSVVGSNIAEDRFSSAEAWAPQLVVAGPVPREYFKAWRLWLVGHVHLLVTCQKLVQSLAARSGAQQSLTRARVTGLVLRLFYDALFWDGLSQPGHPSCRLSHGTMWFWSVVFPDLYPLLFSLQIYLAAPRWP